MTLAIADNLFEAPPTPIMQAAKAGKITLRPYQQEDVASVLRWHQTTQSVLGRAATGLGKAMELAALAEHYGREGRVMILVDVSKLVWQLRDTVHAYTGTQPAVEMADSYASNRSRVVVGTVQTQLTGKQGNERYRNFDPHEFSALLLDECELFLAPRALEVVRYYMTNPRLKVFGCSATPFRTDGVQMRDLFKEIAFDRDLVWGRDNGYLVPVRQGFVHVEIDFGSIRLKDGKDFTDQQIDDLLTESAKPMMTLAKGIIEAAGDDRSIIACPGTNAANMIADFLNAERDGCARAVHSKLDDEENDRWMDSHQRGDFQFLVSVMKLTKGYDDPGAVKFFNCRPTKSKRLYAQMVGRVARPSRSIASKLGQIEAAEDRRDLIAQSDKPLCYMYNLVGIDRSVMHMQVADILGDGTPAHILERVKRDMLLKRSLRDDTFDADKETARATEEVAAEEREAEAKASAARQRVQVDAKVLVEYEGDGSAPTNTIATKEPATPSQIRMLIALGMDAAKARACNKTQAATIITKLKKQGKVEDWTRTRGVSTKAADAPSATRGEPGPSSWQREKLAMLGHKGPMPATYSAATHLIADLGSVKRGGQ